MFIDFFSPLYMTFKDPSFYFLKFHHPLSFDLKIRCFCGSSRYTSFMMFDKAAIYKCVDCGLMQTYPFISLSKQNDKAQALASPEWAIRLRKRWVKKDIRIVQRYKAENERLKVLEIGFGDGLFLKEVKAKGWEAYGVELNSANCKYAQEVLGLSGIYNEELQKLCFPEANFDVAVLTHVLEHIELLKETLSEIMRILKPSGILFISTPNIQGLFIKISGLRKFLKSMIENSGHVWHFTPKTLRQLISNSGFQILKLSLGSMHHGNFSPSPKGLIKFAILIFAKVFNMGDNILLVARKPK
jgi:2-polyprenyl-3-methyl-5-hydroxy-6-metoxy-1,4-benzoquinol methylase